MNTNKFIISDKQLELDHKLIPYDLWVSTAHVLMLGKQKLISKETAQKILTALGEIEKEFSQGKFHINPDLGLHLSMEARVIEKIGDGGYSMHTGKSRNDQIATVELLYLREMLLGLSHKLLRLLKLLKEMAMENIGTIMPGYTHMQPAKPTTFGQWSLSYFDMFMRCFEALKYIWDSYNFCPLGSAESYGTSWKIDRNYTSQLLGFAAVWEIPQDAISSRGAAALACLGTFKDVGIVLGKLSTDLLLFTTFEYGYVELRDQVAKQMSSATGSSIMPQKKNPDVLELIRATAPQLIGFESIVSNLLTGLPMGYNRDSREVKEYFGLGLQKTGQALDSLTQVLGNIEVKKEKMLASVTQNYSMSTDLADYIAQKYGLPYRKMYKVVGEAVKNLKEENLSLTGLSAADLNMLAQKYKLDFQISSAELDEALDPHIAIRKRLHAGGAVPAVMEKMIIRRGKLLEAQAKWIKNKSAGIDQAKRKTEQTIKKFIRE